jgi:DNA-binding IclR family transcriptional regulator
MTKKSKSNQYEIKVVEKAIRVLGLLADGKSRTLTEISQETDIHKSTIFRLLATLTKHKFLLANDRTHKYRLGLACLELTSAYQSGNQVVAASQSELLKLRDSTKETIHLAVLDGLEIVYLEKLESLHAIGLMRSRIGRRAPAHCTGVGKVLLSYEDPEDIEHQLNGQELERFNERTIVDLDLLFKELKLSRQRGYALDQGEHENEVRCVAAPIFDQSGNAIAAVSVSGPSHRMDPVDQNKTLINLSMETAQEISAKLGYAPHK